MRGQQRPSGEFLRRAAGAPASVMKPVIARFDRQQRWLTLFVLLFPVGLILPAVGTSRPDWSWVVGPGIGVGLVSVLGMLWNVRCPACRKLVMATHGPLRSCPRCGVRLRG